MGLSLYVELSFYIAYYRRQDLLQSNILSLVLALLVSIFLGPILPGNGPSKETSNPSSIGQHSQPNMVTAKGDKLVLGYFIDGNGTRSSINSLQANSSKITGIGGFWYTFDESGAVYGRGNSQAFTSAHNAGIAVYPLIHNIQNGYFNKKLANIVLSDKVRRKRLVEGTAALAHKDGAKGVVIDIENLYPSDRGIFEVYLTELKSAVGPDRDIIVAVPAKHRDDWTSSWSGAFDYTRVGKIADYLALMSYDQHTLGSGPGPVASIEWTEKVIRYTVERVPAQKVLLGLAGYGYQWKNGKGHKAVTHPEVVNLSRNNNTETIWSTAHSSPLLSFVDAQGKRNEVWFENHNSLSTKLELVDRYSLGGVALWRLGQEDARIWPKIAQRWFS